MHVHVVINMSHANAGQLATVEEHNKHVGQSSGRCPIVDMRGGDDSWFPAS